MRLRRPFGYTLGLLLPCTTDSSSDLKKEKGEGKALARSEDRRVAEFLFWIDGGRREMTRRTYLLTHEAKLDCTLVKNGKAETWKASEWMGVCCSEHELEPTTPPSTLYLGYVKVTT